MKFNTRHLAVIIALIVIFVLAPKQTSAQQNQVSFQVFYDELSPYGQWIEYQNYGYVWIPDAGADFVPYSTAGYWQLTDYGWTWVSDYEWGWAPFHYGRWGYDNYYGWLWVPDVEWGPSWVNWRSAEGYYGWSPMEPGISLSLSFGRAYDRNNDHWMFVRDRDFERHDLNRYSVNRSENARIIGSSKMINTTYIDSRRTIYVAGPARDDVQRDIGRKINPIAIQENSRPGKDQNNGKLKIYRPQIEKSNINGSRPAPGRISNLKDIKQPSERKGIIQPRSAGSQNNAPVKPLPSLNVTPPKNGSQQPAVGVPQNNRSNSQQQRTSPNNNLRQQPAVVAPQKNPVNSLPVRQSATAPVNSNVKSLPGTTQPNNSGYARPVQTRPPAPAVNNRKQEQPNNVRPQNNNNQVRPSQPLPRSAPSTRTQQPAESRPPNGNAQRPAQPQNAHQGQNIRQQPQNIAKPQNRVPPASPRETKSEPDKR